GARAPRGAARRPPGGRVARRRGGGGQNPPRSPVDAPFRAAAGRAMPPPLKRKGPPAPPRERRPRHGWAANSFWILAVFCSSTAADVPGVRKVAFCAGHDYEGLTKFS